MISAKHYLSTRKQLIKVKEELDKLKKTSGIDKIEEKVKNLELELESHTELMRDSLLQEEWDRLEVEDDGKLFRFTLGKRNVYKYDVEAIKKDFPQDFKAYQVFDGYKWSKSKKSKVVKQYKKVAKTIPNKKITVAELEILKEK